MKDPLERIADLLEEFKDDIHDMFLIRKLGFLLAVLWFLFLGAQAVAIMIVGVF